MFCARCGSEVKDLEKIKNGGTFCSFCGAKLLHLDAAENPLDNQKTEAEKPKPEPVVIKPEPVVVKPEPVMMKTDPVVLNPEPASELKTEVWVQSDYQPDIRKTKKNSPKTAKRKNGKVGLIIFLIIILLLLGMVGVGIGYESLYMPGSNGCFNDTNWNSNRENLDELIPAGASVTEDYRLVYSMGAYVDHNKSYLGLLGVDDSKSVIEFSLDSEKEVREVKVVITSKNDFLQKINWAILYSKMTFQFSDKASGDKISDEYACWNTKAGKLSISRETDTNLTVLYFVE